MLDLPVMLREILTARFSLDPEMQLFAEDTDVIPDTAIVGTSDPNDLVTLTMFLCRWPEALIVMLRTDGRDAVLYALQRTPLPEVSPDELAAAVRVGAEPRH